MNTILITGGGLGAWAIGQILQIDGEKVGVIEQLEGVGVQQSVRLSPLVEVVEPRLVLPPAPPWQSTRPYLKKKKGRS